MVAALPVEEQALERFFDEDRLAVAWARCGVKPFDTNPRLDTRHYSEALEDLSGPADLLSMIEELLKEREE